MARLVRQSRLLLHSTVRTRIGSVSPAGFNRNSRGVSLVNRRIFGRYALVYLLDGSGRMQAGNLPTVPCRAGDLIVVYPEIPHGYGPGPGESWSEFYICFEGPVFDLWRRQGLLDPDRPVHHLPQLRRRLAQLEAVVDPRLPDSASGMLERICRLQRFLCDISDDQRPPSAGVPWLDEAKRLLAEPLGPRPSDVARRLGLSAETFRKNFVRHTGHPPARFRAVHLINQARVLMTERGLRNKEVAATLGFCDEFHFSRRFRGITGLSTREFRRRLRGDKTTSKTAN